MRKPLRICRKCHKPSSRDVCETCRKVTKVFVDRQRGSIKKGEKAEWLAAVEAQLFRS